MPVEIRELVIKTQIQSSKLRDEDTSAKQLRDLKAELMLECKRALKVDARRNKFTR